MPTTPKHALPYPAPTDPVNQGAANFQSLATALDSAILVPSGGAAGSYLAKTSATDFATGWVPLGGGWVPAGGAIGQVLTKTGSADYATGWQTPSGGGAGPIVWTFPPLTWNNNAAEKALVSQVVPGGTLGTAKRIRLLAYGDQLQNGVGGTPRWKVKWGGAAIWDAATPTMTLSAVRNAWLVSVELAASSDAGHQALGGSIRIGARSAPTVELQDDVGLLAAGIGGFGSTDFAQAVVASNGPVAVDSTVAQTFELTFTHSTAHTSNELRLFAAILEVFG